MRFSNLLMGAAAVAAIGLPGWAYGDSFAEKCPDLPACAKAVSELLGQKYVFDADFKGRMLATPNLEMTRENAELVFTNMLHQAGYSRVPLGQPGVFQILRQRDARDSTLPLISATEKHAPELPNTWDLVTLSYKATNPEVVEQIARTARSFMPANARIIPSDLSGTLLVTDSAANLKKLYAIIRDLDRKPTPEMKKRWAEEEKMRLERRPPPPVQSRGHGPGERPGLGERPGPGRSGPRPGRPPGMPPEHSEGPGPGES